MTTLEFKIMELEKALDEVKVLLEEVKQELGKEKKKPAQEKEKCEAKDTIDEIKKTALEHFDITEKELDQIEEIVKKIMANDEDCRDAYRILFASVGK